MEDAARPVGPTPSLLFELGEVGRRPMDIFGQGAVGHSLYAYVYNLLSNNTPNAVVIALKGRYGQGKSTVLGRLIGQLDGRYIDNRRIRISEFDVGRCRVDEISFEFSKLIGHWHARRRWLYYIPVLIAAVAFYAIAGAGLRNLGLTALADKALPFAAGLIGLATVLLTVARKVLPKGSEFWRQPLFSDGVTLANAGAVVKVMVDALLGLPDILVIDNMDRASADQQRAFLTSVRRYRGQLPRIIIIAFDESSLILSDPTPESPRELLEKTFTTSFSLFPLTPKDAVDMTIGIAQNILPKVLQPDPTSPAAFLQFIPILGDFARITILLERHSIRASIQLMNDILASAHVTKITHPADFAALLRLRGLFVLVPWLQHDPQALASYLATDDHQGLIRYSEGIVGRAFSPTEHDRICRYVLRTRHMQPYMAGWKHFTGRFVREADPRPPVASDAFWMPRVDDSPEISQGLAWEDARSWLEFDLRVTQEQDYKSRRDMYVSAIQERRGLGTSSAERLSWGYLTHRLWYADADLGQMTASLATCPRERFLLCDDFLIDAMFEGREVDQNGLHKRKVVEAFVQLLPSARGHLGMSRAQVAYFIAADVFAAGAPARDEGVLRAWMGAAESDEPGCEIAQEFMTLRLNAGPRANVGILTQSWPTLKAEGDPSEVIENLHENIRSLTYLWCARSRVPFSKMLSRSFEYLVRHDLEGRNLASPFLRAMCAGLPKYAAGGEGAWESFPGSQLRDSMLLAAVPEGALGRWLASASTDRLDQAERWSCLYLAILCGERTAAEIVAGQISLCKPDIGFLAGLLSEAESVDYASGNRSESAGKLIAAVLHSEVVRGRLRPSVQALQSSSEIVHHTLALRLPSIGLIV